MGLDITGIGSAVTGVKDILGMFFPDKTQEEKDKIAQAFSLIQLQQQADATQVAVNTTEASNTSLFVSGWRPAVGWVCAMAFAAKFMGGPLVFLVAEFLEKAIVLPPIDMTEMLPILIGMLGLGSMRTFEKLNGVASK
jgi:hypothetical protein